MERKTTLKRVEKLAASLGYNNTVAVDAIDIGGGLALFWLSNNIYSLRFLLVYPL